LALDRSALAEPVTFSVCAGGLPVMRVLTVEHRSDIAAEFGNAGLNGFRVKIPSEFLDN